MIYEEAKEYLLQNFFDGDEDTRAVTECDCETEAMKIAIECIENQIEYRWHNLLDDPKDLPCDMDSIVVEVKFGDGITYDTGYYNTKYSRFSLKCTSPNARIIRWKKIDKEG